MQFLSLELGLRSRDRGFLSPEHTMNCCAERGLIGRWCVFPAEPHQPQITNLILVSSASSRPLIGWNSQAKLLFSFSVPPLGCLNCIRFLSCSSKETTGLKLTTYTKKGADSKSYFIVLHRIETQIMAPQLAWNVLGNMGGNRTTEEGSYPDSRPIYVAFLLIDHLPLGT